MGRAPQRDQGTDVHTRDTADHPTGAGRLLHTFCPPHQPPRSTLAGTQNGYALDSGCPATDTALPTTWLTLARNVAAYHGMTQTLRWMSWPKDKEQTLKLRTASRQTHANKMQGMHWPREGRGPAYSKFPKPQRPETSPPPSTRTGATQTTTTTGGTGAPKIAPPLPERKPKPQICPYFSPEERKAMHLEYPDRAEVQGVYVCSLKGQPKQWVWIRGTVKCALASPGKHRATAGRGRESDHIQL